MLEQETKRVTDPEKSPKEGIRQIKADGNHKKPKSEDGTRIVKRRSYVTRLVIV